MRTPVNGDPELGRVLPASDTAVPRPGREGVVVAAAFVVCLLGGTVRVEDTLTAPPPAAWLLALVSCAVLPARHRRPWPCWPPPPWPVSPPSRSVWC